ncbi:outer membrane beta-barrel protein [Parvularcula dongshanensis]|uniref:Opacity protein-like surface antigen n=1 Tax=Parvularcula dongshanensis TaxID=1173995 RepID=A0A840HZ60_9PROT|nr:outer membrane beta-barrel protein [Parvularcula dongshanensis]MBB4657717.1 opacity protein-like surface antigen [Parvularcula dongshanensis]
MNKRLFIASAAASGLFVPGIAAAQSDDGGAYFQVHLGPAFGIEGKYPSLYGARFDLDFDAGGALGLIGGYRAASGFGAEIELGSRAHDTNQIGDFGVSFLMANAVYEFVQDGRWRPYVAGGIGIVGSDAFNYEDTSLGGQLKGGLRYRFGQTQSVGLEASYFGAHGLGNDTYPIDYGSISVSVAYRIGLGS